MFAKRVEVNLVYATKPRIAFDLNYVIQDLIRKSVHSPEKSSLNAFVMRCLECSSLSVIRLSEMKLNRLFRLSFILFCRP